MHNQEIDKSGRVTYFSTVTKYVVAGYPAPIESVGIYRNACMDAPENYSYHTLNDKRSQLILI